MILKSPEVNLMNYTANRGLLNFDKLNIALCAQKRALENAKFYDGRFEGEYDTTVLWMRHSLFTMGGVNWTA